MAEEPVKRLVPTKDTLRELYLKSGNRCAFPDCTALMLDTEGDFIGQITHIEAAEIGGPRFNENMSNEERRSFTNLILMCYPHHVKTHDVEKYSVATLKEMKARHEVRFTDVAQTIENAITDHGTKTVAGKAVTLKRWNDVMGWDGSPDILEHSVRGIGWTAHQLHQLPTLTRQLLTVIVGRLNKLCTRGKNYDYERDVLVKEIAEATRLRVADVLDHVRIMEKYRIAEVQEREDENGLRLDIHMREYPDGGFFLGEFKEYCARTQLPLSALIEELRFDLLD